jgi:hypothetical protein
MFSSCSQQGGVVTVVELMVLKKSCGRLIFVVVFVEEGFFVQSVH